ncbi:MAG: CAP domain-containing protein [Myxococcota bacterium]
MRLVLMLLLAGCDLETIGEIDPNPNPGDTGALGDDGESQGDAPRNDGDADPVKDADPGQEADEPVEDDPDEIPASEVCHPDIEGWPSEWSTFEDEVLALVNAVRATGYDCDSEGVFGAAAPVETNPQLRCAARYHSLWMTENGMQHDSPGGDLGDDPWARMNSAGFTGAGIGENIAAGYASPETVVQRWLDSDGHCANMMNSGARLLGVGYAYDSGADYRSYWTQKFGR